jgi:hypothetical protein
MHFFGPGPMRDVYLDFRLPWPAKIAAGMLTPGKWRPFEIYLTTTWTAPYFDHTYLGFSSIKSNGFFTKTVGLIFFLIILRFCGYLLEFLALIQYFYEIQNTNCG